MSEIKIEILKQIADNQNLFDAVKKTIEKHFSLDDINSDTPNLAEKVRARLDGKELLKNAFKEISSHKTFKENPIIGNPAR